MRSLARAGVVLAMTVAGATILAEQGQRAGADTPASATPANAALRNPAAFTDIAPATYRALFETTAGMFVVQVQRASAPHGANRFYNLVKRGFYDDCRFFRVVANFMVQFGIHGDPAVSAAWSRATIPPDRPRLSNTRGRVTFAMANAADTRTTQVFINLGDNSKLDLQGFAPFGEVVSSMVLVERIYSEYGEGPNQGRIEMEGNAFLIKYLPRLDYIKKATIAQ